MKHRWLLTGLTLFALSFGLPSNRLYISGSVHFKNERAVSAAGLSLFVKANERIIASTDVDSLGQYEISFILDQQPSFDFFFAGSGQDTTFIKSFTEFESDLMTWDIELPERRSP